MANQAFLPLADLPATVSRRTLTRVSRRLAAPAGAAPWAPPPLPELIARIDEALATRRGA